MDTHFSLSWDAYQKNICSGLSGLQQRGEFVDMTLAADGHHVKVHQMVLSLVSPYIKDLITSAQCPHPVIFLNNISYTTLCFVLEYVYTGEVHVPKTSISDLLVAGKALHIKGLQEMEDISIFQNDTSQTQDNNNITHDDHSVMDDDNSNSRAGGDDKLTQGNKTLLEQLKECKENKKSGAGSKESKAVPPLCKIFVEDGSHMEFIEGSLEIENTEGKEDKFKTIQSHNAEEMYKNKKLGGNSNTVQYSLSNQGGLQLIFNRYIYALKYVQKKLIKFWRCADCGSKKCPANIYTNEKNQVIRRTFNHNHPFHDKNILKKMRSGIVFTAFSEAESRAGFKKTEEKEPSLPTTEYTDTD